MKTDFDRDARSLDWSSIIAPLGICSGRNINSERASQIDLVFLFLHNNLPECFAEREFTERLSLPNSRPEILDRFDFVIQI